MHALAPTVRRWRAAGRAVALVRPVDAVGFGARYPGEALAVADDGETAGSLLGGAVTASALPVARELLAGGTGPRLLRVPVDADGAAACGLACSGEARLLVGLADDLPDEVWTALAAGRSAAVVTSVGGGPGPATVAADEAEIRRLTGRPRTGRSDGRLLDRPEGTVAVEWWVPAGRLVLTGAEGLAAAVAAQAGLLGWPVEVLPTGEAAEAARAAGPADAVVVLSHDPDIDTPVLLAALVGDAGYIGAIGSRGTQVARGPRLVTAGADPAALPRIYGPVGLDLGGTNPAETALSVCAEILAVRAGRSAAPLRTTSGSITG